MLQRNYTYPAKQARALKLGVAITATIAAASLSQAQIAHGKAIPAENLTQNPSFQQNTSGWNGFQASVRKVKTRRAPAGHKAARVEAMAGVDTYTVDDAPSTVTEGVTAGMDFTASAYVKGTRTTAGAAVGLVIRESTATGEFVADSEQQIKLNRRKFKRIETTYEAQGDGSTVDVYVRRPNVRKDDAFLADAITFVSDQLVPDDPPVEDPPDDDPPVEDPSPTAAPITTSQLANVTSHEDALFEDDESKYRYIVIRDSLHGRLEELREAHPESEILLYKNTAFTLYEPGCPYYPFQGGGLSYCDADEGHENWFLHSASNGNRLSSSGYSGQRAMNIANNGYRQALADSVLARLGDAHDDGSNAKYDGVFFDDVNLYPGHGMDGNIAELTDNEYRQAMAEMIDSVSNQARDAGFTTMVNVGMNPWEPAERSATLQMARDVDVINREGFVHWGENGTLFTDPDGAAPHWYDEVELAEDIQAAGASINGMVYGSPDDTQTQRYARATFLMAWNGEDGSAVDYRTIAPVNSWLPDWTTDVGTPTEDRRQVGQGWRRDFTDGTVVINARGSGSQQFNLGGKYRTPDGSCPGSVTLGAAKGMVLPDC